MFDERTTLQRLLLLKALSGGGQSPVERTALGSGTEENPEDHVDVSSDETLEELDRLIAELPDDPEEEIPDNTEEGSEPDD